MTNSIATAYRILGHFWLEEVRPDDIDTIAALPELAQTLPDTDRSALAHMAVEYQRLFGFNLPPYESIFIDPSAMLMAPATERIQALYRQAGWTLPEGIRAGAPDHLGAELLALADWQDSAQLDWAQHMHARHLALWAPAFIITLRRLAPPPFYHTLGDLTLDLLLSTLPEVAIPRRNDLFSEISSPSVYPDGKARPSDQPNYGNVPEIMPLPVAEPTSEDAPAEVTLRKIVNHLLTARAAGLHLTREDLAYMGKALELPGIMGERHRMLDALFRQAGQYDLVSDLVEQLEQLVANTSAAYQELVDEYPLWLPYARAWENQLKRSRRLLNDMKGATAQFDERLV